MFQALVQLLSAAAPWLISGAVAAAAVALTVAVINWSAISNWFNQHRNRAKYGAVIKEHLSNGKIGLVTGVFDDFGEILVRQSWVADQLDADLAGRFGGLDELNIVL